MRYHVIHGWDDTDGTTYTSFLVTLYEGFTPNQTTVGILRVSLPGVVAFDTHAWEAVGEYLLSNGLLSIGAPLPELPHPPFITQPEIPTKYQTPVATLGAQ